MSRFKTFVNKNLVVIVMIPSLIGIHWGWYQLHQNDALVPPDQRQDMPLIKMVKRGWSMISTGGGAADSMPAPPPPAGEAK